MRILIGLAIGITAGALLGYSQILCPTGTCILTGTWYGGAMTGAVLSLIFTSGCPLCSAGRCQTNQCNQNEPARPQNE